MHKLYEATSVQLFKSGPRTTLKRLSFYHLQTPLKLLATWLGYRKLQSIYKSANRVNPDELSLQFSCALDDLFHKAVGLDRSNCFCIHVDVKTVDGAKIDGLYGWACMDNFIVNFTWQCEPSYNFISINSYGSINSGTINSDFKLSTANRSILPQIKIPQKSKQALQWLKMWRRLKTILIMKTVSEYIFTNCLV